MTTIPKLVETVEIVLGTTATPETPPDPFNPDNLRLSQSFTETVGVKKLLTTVPVRKPSKTSCGCTQPGISRDWEETSSRSRARGGRRVRHEDLFWRSIGTPFFWPVRLPSPDGKDLDWWRSGREAAGMAMRDWVRVKANMNLGAYDIWKAESVISEPEWPQLGFWDLIRLAFKDHLITTTDHLVIKRLRGQI